MSTAFTAVTDWGNYGQARVGANEIVLAYSERRQCLDQSAVDPLTVGADGQDKTLWLAMQEWCEANCTSFLDHVSGPLNPGGTDFLYFTLATWRAAAGLNASGFRRKVEAADAFSYGTILKGDVRGSWCFEDLQKGFSALRWTLSGGGVQNGINKTVTGSGMSTPEAALADYLARWAGESFSAPGGYMYAVEGVFAFIAGNYMYHGTRYLGQTTVTGLTTVIPHVADIYITPYTNIFPRFQDYDSFGFVIGHPLYWMTISSSNSGSHIVTDYLVPLTAAAPISSSMDGNWRGVDVASTWLLKWEPTNQNA